LLIQTLLVLNVITEPNRKIALVLSPLLVSISPVYLLLYIIARDYEFNEFFIQLAIIGINPHTSTILAMKK